MSGSKPVSVVGPRAWIWSVTAAVTAVAGFLGLVRAPAPATGRPERPGAAMTWLGSEQATRLGVVGGIYDPAPLFLPTQWNAQSEALRADRLRVPGDSFGTNPARLVFPEAEARIDLAPPLRVPESAVDSVGLTPPAAPFEGLGRQARPAPLVATEPTMEVISVINGRPVELPPNLLRGANPPAVGDWQPLELVMRVRADGLVDTPAIRRSSNRPAIDRYFQEFIRREIRLGLWVPPGDYHVIIGP